MNISSVLKELSDKIPNKTAIIDTKNSSRISFNYLEKNTSKIANMFKSIGLEEGNTILLWIPVSVEFYSILMAAFKMRLNVIFIDITEGIEHVKRSSKEYNPDMLIVFNKKDALKSYFHKEIKKIPHKYILDGKVPYFKIFAGYEEFSDKFDLAHEKIDSDNNINCSKFVITIKENTGKYRDFINTEQSLIKQQKVLEKLLNIEQGNKVLVLFPLFIIISVLSGLTTIISNVDIYNEDEIDVNQILNQVMIESIETIIAPIIFFNSLLDLYNRTGRSIHTVKKIVILGEPILPGVLENIKKVFPYAEIQELYGLSVTEPIAELSYNEVLEEDIEKMKLGNGLLVGKVIKEIDFKIIKNSSKNLSEEDIKILSKGEKGELLISGEHITGSLINDSSEKNKEIKIKNKSWYRTGDLAYLDVDNKLWLLGKNNIEIQRDDRNISHLAVEAILSFERNISKAAILEKKSKIFLFIESIYRESKEDELELHDSIREKIKELGLKVNEIIFLEKIPLNKYFMEKIDYHNLEKLTEKYI